MDDGWIWYSAARATVALIVRDDVVVDCPPYARRYALGRPAAEVWRRAEAGGVQLQWFAAAADVVTPRVAAVSDSRQSR